MPACLHRANRRRIWTVRTGLNQGDSLKLVVHMPSYRIPPCKKANKNNFCIHCRMTIHKTVNKINTLSSKYEISVFIITIADGVVIVVVVVVLVVTA